MFYARRLPRLAVLALAIAATACGGDDDRSLEDFYPDLPEPTGDAQSVYAGQIDGADELVDGDAAYGMAGDYFIRNSRAQFIIQAATRVIGVVPQGGNLIDVVALDETGAPLTEDHFGELSAIYQVARTCEHDAIEVVRDGSGGGAAVVRATGVTQPNNFINFRGIGVFQIPLEIDPEIGDDIACATTYVLEPDAPTLDVYWTYYNAGDEKVVGPFGTFTDSGGETEVFAPPLGFERLGIDAIASLDERKAIDYAVYQGPGVAYGIVPRFDDATEMSQFSIAGISIMLFGSDTLLGILEEDHWLFSLDADDGFTQRAAVVVGRDAASVERQFLALSGVQAATVTGAVAYDSGAQAAGARVGIYIDTDGDGAIGPDDRIRTYVDPDANGAYAADVEPGSYLVRAEVKDTSRSPVRAIDVPATGVDLALPDPIVFDYTIVDDETGNTIPGRIQVIGEHPAFPDLRLFETFDRLEGVVTTIYSARGTSVDVGGGADRPLVLPAGGDYRIFATHGTEWSAAQLALAPTVDDSGTELEFRLRHVAPTSGYVATEFHQHSIGSPDSPLSRETRINTFVAEGVEFFASTDHDYVSDFQPVIESLDLDDRVRAIPGIEVTPFSYGHFQAFPMELDLDDPSHGAIDHPRGTEGYAMIPGEIFAAARDRGAEVVQVNHPRITAGDFSDLQRYFDRAGLVFDYEARTVMGDPLVATVPFEWMRLPETTIWDDSFDALEVWNGHTIKDSNDDGVRENGQLDVVLRDWFNFLSFGMQITPMGNSDTHTRVKDPAGMPRTYVRVANDSIENASVVDDILDTLAGRGGTPRDVIVTNGPHIEISVAEHQGPAFGQVVEPSNAGTVTLDISVVAPAWAEVDTIEVFVNSTPDSTRKDETWLQPAACFTSRTVASLPASEPCALAPLGPVQTTIELVEVAPGFLRWEGTAQLTLAATDMAMLNRSGAMGTDAWIVVRARGNRALYPVMTADTISADNLAVLVAGDAQAVAAELANTGIPAAAFTSPIYVDFDGGGYRAPFEP